MKDYAVWVLCAGTVISSCKKDKVCNPRLHALASQIVVANNRPGEFYRFSSVYKTQPTGSGTTETTYSMLFADPTGRTESVLEIMAGAVSTSTPEDFNVSRFEQKMWAVFAPGMHTLDRSVSNRTQGFKIIYVDAHGHQWYSYLGNQNNDDIFNIFDTEMQCYEHQVSLTAKVKFSCHLYDHQGNSILLSATALPMAVDYQF